ncbi:PIN domain-containing protein [Rhizobium leguminosarum]|uniref:PIN domain-containing protein n=1 Tax=Rhizobium leguminosarum TaxID=384 RepID=UPI001C98DFC4|nr:PIN domain-containing protein [Rhizobium leguminosarum]MBY5465251.1 PIN domain-containing protein [Rhizobium leguminosarum]
MFANRFTALVDACTLADTLRRNLLLTLAEAEFFRLRWSEKILDETQAAVQKMLEGKGQVDAPEHGKRARRNMEAAFEDALVSDYGAYLPSCAGLPDPNDAHVVAAALKTQAALIVTENLKDFPATVLRSLNLEAKSADAFLADTFALDPGKAVNAIQRMRARFKKPELTADQLLLEMEARGLIETVDVLKPYTNSI